jgi:methylmalonyl-CoA mutase
MAAILGGCDSLLVKPYDECFREPGHFSERLARNLQVILREESYFDKVADVAGGSYYIESITKSLCEKAWNLFLEIEEKGGYVEFFRNGYIQKEIRETANKRIERTACGKEILLGTNAYPEFNEKVLGEINEKTVFYRMPAVPDQIAEPVVETRASTAFEKIRLAIEKQPGKRPEVFMLTYGSLAGRLARAQFSSNYFASAGYQVIENTGFDKPEDGVTKALRRKADIIVACSSDEEYAGTVPEIHDRINGKALLVVAGAPSCMEELKKKGIQHFIYTGSNMIETFHDINERLGILL